MSVEITEGSTRLYVPKGSLVEQVPPRSPAFFNPRARLSRDYSMIAYAAFLRGFEGPRVFLESLAGIGARGIRASNELDIENLVINDLNPSALEMARHSARINGITDVEFWQDEACRFLSRHSQRGRRGAIVDIDPFGSPASFFDCGIRATMHGGMLSVTATDLQVLNGLFPSACKRKYGGLPIRVQYGNELAIRLLLGCLRAVSARLATKIQPLFAESTMHYYRVYVRVLDKRDQAENLGYMLHCRSCGNRHALQALEQKCRMCGGMADMAGPLWTDKIFDRRFLQKMLDEIPRLNVDKACQKMVQKNIEEAGLPPGFFTLDEIAAATKSSPPKLAHLVSRLQKNGFTASLTAFSPTGFRTDAGISEIKEVFQAMSPRQT